MISIRHTPFLASPSRRAGDSPLFSRSCVPFRRRRRRQQRSHLYGRRGVPTVVAAPLPALVPPQQPRAPRRARSEVSDGASEKNVSMSNLPIDFVKFELSNGVLSTTCDQPPFAINEIINRPLFQIYPILFQPRRPRGGSPWAPQGPEASILPAGRRHPGGGALQGRAHQDAVRERRSERRGSSGVRCTTAAPEPIGSSARGVQGPSRSGSPVGAPS